MPEETPQPEVIPSTPASPDTQAWHAYRRSTEQQEPQRLEEAAKFLAGMASITQSCTTCMR